MKRTLVFWMWNDQLDAAEIRRQIYEFHRQHVEGFFVHAMPSEFRQDDFPGGMPGYLSEYFFDMIGVALECASELKMELWLYDEGGWPSGTVNETLVKEHPELRLQRIFPDGTTEYFDERPDLLNPEVTELFIQSVHEKYKKRFADEFGKTIPGIFTDEPFFGNFVPDGELPWSPVLAARFRQRKNMDAADAAMRIFHEKDPQALQDYCEVWNELMIDGFMRPLRNWCHENNLLFTGHFNGDDCVANVVKLLGSDIFSIHKFFDMPGCDAIWRQIHPLEKESDFSRLTSSAAGEKTSISETFAVYGADLSLAEMKNIAAMQFVSGINIVAPMAVHYSDRGGRQVTTDSNFFGNDPRWAHYHCFADFSRRMSKVFDRCVPVIKATVPFPVTKLRRGEDAGDIFAAGLALAVRQITYDYAPDAPKLPEKIIPDVELFAPCPALRTRHLRSPRGERRIFVNSGVAKIDCKFRAPEGFNVWFDPDSGKRYPAYADSDNWLTLELPFAGSAVLLTVPGRKQQMRVMSEKERREKLDFRFTGVVNGVKGSENGLISIPVPENLDENFCGTYRCETGIILPEKRSGRVVLPRALRSVCALEVNGEKLSVRAWGPYHWDIQLPSGKNVLAVEITTTAAPAVYADSHVEMLKSKGYLNDYRQQCIDFPRMFPDETPLQEAYIDLFI